MTESLVKKIDRKVATYLPTKPFKIKPGRSVVSFTFDDFPRSALTCAGPVLAKNGGAGTYYVAGGLTGTGGEMGPLHLIDDLKALSGDGHEIGCHTFDHKSCQSLTGAALAKQCKQNADILEDATGTRPVNFAYPFGHMDLSSKRTIGRLFVTGRSVVQGVNRGWADLAALKVIRLYDNANSLGGITQILEDTKTRGGWTIFYTHDVQNNPSQFGCSTNLFRSVVEETVQMHIDIKTMRNATGVFAF